MLDEPRYQEIREQLQDNPSRAEGLMVLSRLAAVMSNEEFELAAKVAAERRQKIQESLKAKYHEAMAFQQKAR